MLTVAQSSLRGPPRTPNTSSFPVAHAHFAYHNHQAKSTLVSPEWSPLSICPVSASLPANRPAQSQTIRHTHPRTFYAINRSQASPVQSLPRLTYPSAAFVSPAGTAVRGTQTGLCLDSRPVLPPGGIIIVARLTWRRRETRTSRRSEHARSAKPACLNVQFRH